MEAAYEDRRRDGKLPATYEVVYGHAWKGSGKKLAKVSDDGRQVIEFVKNRRAPNRRRNQEP